MLFIMYSNPCGSPQLGNFSGILAEQGCKVAFLGTGSLGTNEFRFAEHPNMQIHLWKFRPSGLRQKIQFLLFFFRCLWWVITWRPNYVHGSDPYSTPFLVAISLLTRTPVIYQEHDSPNVSNHPTKFQKFNYWTRGLIARRAFTNLLPNKDRAANFSLETATKRPVELLWNVPRRREAEIVPAKATVFTLFYHGSIVPARLPITLVQALAMLPAGIELAIAGYETVGSRGYLDKFRALARELGVESRVKFLGSFSYHKLLPICRTAHVGVSFMPKATTDINERHMIGASIKAFDYMACGVPLLVTDLPDWVETYVHPGYALSCDPEDAMSIVEKVRWYFEHSLEREQMGKNARHRIIDDWNYETKMQFLIEKMGK